jgi:RNA polymerase sigma factor for flagellar operon FliA
LQQVVRRVARRHRLRDDAAEDLLSVMHLKLIENGYEVLRRFEGRAALSTYLSSIATRHVMDERNRSWGKWRPSVFATQHGPVAVRLETLITRDGLSFGEAVHVLRTNLQVAESEAELYRLSLGFPRRSSRRFVEADILDQVPGVESAEDVVERQRRTALATRVHAALDLALESLGDDDRVLLRMCFERNLPLSQVARALGVEQKPLYRRRDHVYDVLRKALEQKGFSKADILDITGGDLRHPVEGAEESA